MKKYSMSFLQALFTLTGCYDLDRAPYDQLSSSTFWQTEDQCKQGLMGVYASLKNTDLYGKMFMIDVNSDVAAGYDQYEALQLGTCRIPERQMAKRIQRHSACQPGYPQHRRGSY